MHPSVPSHGYTIAHGVGHKIVWESDSVTKSFMVYPFNSMSLCGEEETSKQQAQ